MTVLDSIFIAPGTATPLFNASSVKIPVGLSGGDVNLYAYTGNNLLDYIDSTGTDKKKKLSCSADAVFNFGLGFVTWIQCREIRRGFTGVNFHPFESYFSDSPGVTADPTQFQGRIGAGGRIQNVHCRSSLRSGGR